ncbi:MAG: GNAT family N-acetyltransferase [Candidatus Izemoplasmatales bacterium]
MTLNIRNENKKDQGIVEEMTRQAFYKEKDKEEKGFGCSEHFFVHLLRKKDGIQDLNLVATIQDEIVGHVIYSKSYIQTPDKKLPVITFGPLTVKKAYQNKGIGSQLLKYSLEKAKGLGFGAVIIFGHPNYYPRFGFVPARHYNLKTKDGQTFDAFMALELKTGYLSNIEGKFIESDIFDETKYKEEIIKFDQRFQ